MDIVLLLPLLIPFSTAILNLLAWNRHRFQRSLSVAGAALLLLAGLLLLLSVWANGIQVTQIGDWPAPFGITLVADLFSAVMVIVTGIVGLTVCVYSLANVDEERKRYNYFALVHFLLVGVCGAFLTGDIFNLYVWFEVLLIASFVLLALGGERPQLEGTIKYLTLNLLSSTLFLVAIALLYSLTGTLNFADLAQRMQAIGQDGLVTTIAVLFLVAFGIKAGLFPLFFWLPSAYHTPPVAVTTLFSGLMTKVGVYALVRVFTLLFIQDIGYTHTLILIFAGLTMVIGVLGAVAQMEIRRLLSFHIISQIGYLMMGLGIFTLLSLAGMIFFMVHVILAKSALFFVSGIIHQYQGSFHLKKLGGLYTSHLGLAVLFGIPALALAGIPPLSGFWAKLTLVRAGLESEQYWLVLVSLAVSMLTLFSMTKIWMEAFWKAKPEGTAEIAVEGATRLSLLLPLIFLVALLLIIGLIAEPLMAISLRAAEQLLNPAGYIAAVMGG